MRNDTENWDVPFSPDTVRVGDEVEIRSHRFDRLTLLSGSTVRATCALPLLGWPDVAPDGPFALCLRRDRVLEVNGPARADGWDGGSGWAISTMTDAYHSFVITGPGALDLLKHGAELSLELPSASVARLVFGQAGMLYRLAPDSYALTLPRSLASAGWGALVGHLG